MSLINIGFGNSINSDKVITIVSPDSAPAKRLIGRAKEQERSIDATQGRKTKAVIIAEDDYVILSALTPETLSARFNGQGDAGSRRKEGDYHGA